MLPCMPTLQGNPLGPKLPNETVFMRIVYDYVFIYVLGAFLPSVPGRARHADPGIKKPPVWAES